MAETVVYTPESQANNVLPWMLANQNNGFFGGNGGSAFWGALLGSIVPGFFGGWGNGFDDLMKAYSQQLKRTNGYYDGPYVWCMATSDYLGSSIIDEQHLAMYVHDYLDDTDGNPTRAFDEFVANCCGKGVDIPWIDLI